MSKPRHADKDSAPTSSGPKQIHHLSNYIFFISAGCISYRSLYFSTAKKLQYQHSGGKR